MTSSIALMLLVILPDTLSAQWRPLLDEELSNFEVFIGVPHVTVEGLPEGTYQSDNVHGGTPLGLGNDPKQIFTVIDVDGGPVLRVSGEIFGGLTSKEVFDNYHLRFKMKWGDKKWPPRLNDKRDSGLLYHCHGDHGSFWKSWKRCLELQIEESDLGDLIPLAGPSARVRGVDHGGWRYDPASESYQKQTGYTHASAEPDKPHGEWNQIDLYTLDDVAVHVVNGEIVMVAELARDRDGNPLTKGQLQIQSEAAECFYKDMEIRPISEFPREIVRHFQGQLDSSSGEGD
jgi:hypothetical protein